FALREHVGKQTIPYVVAERAQDITCFDVTAGSESEAFQTDHRVAAPIREPMISGNYCSHIITRGVSSSSISDTHFGCDQELICSKDQFCGPTGLQFRPCDFDELMPPCKFSLVCLFRVQRKNLFPRFSRCNNSESLSWT